MCRKGVSHGKHGKRVFGETRTRNPKGQWDSRPRKRAGRNPERRDVMEFTDKIINEVAEKFYAESMGKGYRCNEYESAIDVIKTIRSHIDLEELTKLYLVFKTFSEWIQAICETQNKKTIIDNTNSFITDADFEDTYDEISDIDKELLTVEFIRKIVLGKFQ